MRLNRLGILAVICSLVVFSVLVALAFVLPLAHRSWEPIQAGLAKTSPSGGGFSGLASEFPAEHCKDLPWHIADIERFYSDDFKTNALEVDLEVLDYGPYPDNFFVVPIQGVCNGRVFYFARITNVQCGQWKGGKLLALDGAGVVFSRWGDMDPDATQTSDGGYYFVSNREGGFVSV